MTEINLSFEQRMKLAEIPAHCPNCDSIKLSIKTIPNPDNPIKQFQERAIYYCTECGYWTDWFDGYTWHPSKILVGAER